MPKKYISKDEISALVYIANQLENSGYADEAAVIRRQPASTPRIIDMFSTFTSSLFRRDLPAALAYEANQIDAAGYLPEKNDDCPKPGIFEQFKVGMENLTRKLRPGQSQSAMQPARANQGC